MSDRFKYEYEADIIKMMYDICRPKTTPPLARFSDSDIVREQLAVKRFKAARELFEETLRGEVLPLTHLRADAINDVLSMLEDASPDLDVWDEAISKAKADQ